MYLNSILNKTSNLFTGGFNNTAQLLYIGSYGSSERFNGYLDDVRIYNRALSSNEISEIYNRTKNKYQ